MLNLHGGWGGGDITIQCLRVVTPYVIFLELIPVSASIYAVYMSSQMWSPHLYRKKSSVKYVFPYKIVHVRHNVILKSYCCNI